MSPNVRYPLRISLCITVSATLILLCLISLQSIATTDVYAAQPDQSMPTEQDAVTITLWHQLSGDRKQVLHELIEEFETQHPTITVDLVTKGGYDDIYSSVIDVLRKGKTRPNLVFGYPSDFADYARYDGIRFLDDFVEEKLTDFYTATLDYNRLKSYGDRLAGLPVGQSLEVMYYNGDLLASLGMTVPLTAPEFRSACNGIAGSYNGQVTCAILRTDASHLSAVVYAHGGQVLSDDERLARFSEAPGLNPVKEFRHLLDIGHAKLYNGYPNVPFAAREVAFTFGSSSAMQFYDNSVQKEGAVTNWGIAPVPNIDTHNGVILYGPNIAMLRTTQAEEEASWLVMRWLTNPGINARFAVGAGYYPIRISAENHPLVVAKRATSPQYAQGYALLPSGRYEPGPRSWQQARVIIKQALEDIYERGSDVTTTMQQASNEVTQLLVDTGPVSVEIPTTGGTLAYTDTQGDLISVEVPSGALSKTTTLSYVPLTDLPTTGIAFALTPDLTFPIPVSITIAYQDQDIAGMDESSLALYQYNWTTGVWSEAAPCGGYVRDPVGNTLEAGVCHFSDYVVTDAPYRSYVPYLTSH